MPRRERSKSPANVVPLSSRPAFNAADIKSALERYDRTPFMDLLTEMLRFFPDEQSLQALAMKKPELYINSLISMARISGFTEKQEVFHTHTVNLNKMSDSQLEDYAKRLMEEMQMKMIDVSPIVENESNEKGG